MSATSQTLSHLRPSCLSSFQAVESVEEQVTSSTSSTTKTSSATVSENQQIYQHQESYVEQVSSVSKSKQFHHQTACEEFLVSSTNFPYEQNPLNLDNTLSLLRSASASWTVVPSTSRTDSSPTETTKATTARSSSSSSSTTWATRQPTASSTVPAPVLRPVLPAVPPAPRTSHPVRTGCATLSLSGWIFPRQEALWVVSTRFFFIFMALKKSHQMVLRRCKCLQVGCTVCAKIALRYVFFYKTR